MCKVLVVDDSEVSADWMSKYLTLAGNHHVTTCDAVGKAQALMLENRYDVLVFDQLMVPLKGSELLAWARGRGITTPCVIISAVHPDVLRDIEDRAVKNGLSPVIALAKITEDPDELNQTITVLTKAMEQ